MDHVIKYIIVIIFMYLIYLSSKIKIRFILSYHSTIIFDVTLILHNHESSAVHVLNSRFLSTSLHDREPVVIMLVPEIFHEQSLLVPTQRSPDAVFVSG